MKSNSRTNAFRLLSAFHATKGLLPLFLLVLLPIASSLAQTTYTWNATGTGSWATSTNWTPTRTSPANNDILEFSNGQVLTVTNVPTQTIGKLRVTNGTAVNLQADTNPATLTLGGGTDALEVNAGSELNISGSNVLLLNVSTGSTGSVSGNMTFGGAAHKLNGVSGAGGIVTFSSPAVFTQAPGCSGNVFGTTSPYNIIIFQSGTTFVLQDGANPFGADAPNSRVVFQTGSLYQHQVKGVPSVSGRTYADFQFDVNSTTLYKPTGSQTFTCDNFSITQGHLEFQMTGNGHSIKGNLTVASGATLNFNPSSAGTINFNGTNTQTITVNGTLTFQANQSVVFNNSQGVVFQQAQTFAGTSASSVQVQSGTVTLNGDFTINKALNLAGGILDARTSNSTVIATATVTRTAGWVNGKLKRTSLADGDNEFPIGTLAYTPVTVNLTGASGTQLTALSTQGNPPAGSQIDQTKKCDHYWAITLDGGSFGSASAAFNLANTTNGGTLANYEVDKYDGTWATTSSSVSGSVITVTSLLGFGSFEAGEPLNLPVELLYFDAKPVAGKSAELTWSTASEVNNDYFLLDWSKDGRHFETIANVPGSGTSHEPQSYAYLHEGPTDGTNYYRLSQVDFDGRRETFAVKSVYFEPDEWGIRIVPTLVQSELSVQFEHAEGGWVCVLSPEGSLVRRLAVEAGRESVQVDLSGATPGHYWVLYSNGANVFNGKFVKL